MKNKIVLIGGGGHATTVAEIIDTTKNFVIVGFVDPSKTALLSRMGYNWLGSDKILASLKNKTSYFHISIGQLRNSKPRLNLFKKIKQVGGELPPIISSSAVVARSAIVAEGCLVGLGAIINPLSEINENTIINTNVIIEHGCTIGRNCHIAPGAVILGDVKIGDGVFIGAGTVIREGSVIQDDSFIPAGTFINKR